MTRSIKRLITAKSFIIFTFFINTNSIAQSSDTKSIDSLLAQGVIRSRVQSFYVKPILEQYNSLVDVNGEGFSKPHGDILRKRGVGIRIGYQWDRCEIETGLSTIRPAAGFRYPSGYFISTQVRSTDFHQIPLVFRYRIWQPMQRLAIRVGAGVAYNVDLSKMGVSFGNVSEESTLNPDGTKLLLNRFKSQFEQQKSFFSGEVNASAQYQFSTRFSASLEVRRLVSATGIVRYNAIQETFNPPAFHTVESSGGANSYSVNLGLSYQFGFNNRYQLN